MPKVKRHKHKRSPILPLLPLPTKNKKGAIRRRVVAVGVIQSQGREYTLHSTKGYRSSKA